MVCQVMCAMGKSLQREREREREREWGGAKGEEGITERRRIVRGTTGVEVERGGLLVASHTHALKFLRSQILKAPSSPPLASR